MADDWRSVRCCGVWRGRQAAHTAHSAQPPTTIAPPKRPPNKGIRRGDEAQRPRDDTWLATEHRDVGASGGGNEGTGIKDDDMQPRQRTTWGLGQSTWRSMRESRPQFGGHEVRVESPRGHVHGVRHSESQVPHGCGYYAALCGTACRMVMRSVWSALGTRPFLSRPVSLRCGRLIRGARRRESKSSRQHRPDA
jgi:hypothetical protein